MQSCCIWTIYINTMCNLVRHEYYKYLENFTLEHGDRVVRADHKRNWNHYLNMEKSRLMEDVNELLDSGYTIDQIKKIKVLKPYYYFQSAWNSLCEYWWTPKFKMRSELSKKAQMRVEFTPVPWPSHLIRDDM